MGSRADLKTLLESIAGVEKVYIQPPGNETMVYPCIIMHRDRIDTESANNAPYITDIRYSITVIDSTPGSDIALYVSALPKCKHDRYIKMDNLHQDHFTLYY